MKKYEVVVDGKAVVVDTAKEAAKLSGATAKAILAGKAEGVRIIDEEGNAAPLTEVGEAKQDAAAAPEVPVTDDKPETPPATPPTNDDVEYPEVGHFKDEKELKKYIKGKVSDAQLADWCELEGVTYTPCPEHAPINRMRMAMAIKAKHFPDTAPKASTKSKSKYGQYKTEELVQMALDNDIEVTGDNGDMRILRMRTIMALREHKVIE